MTSAQEAMTGKRVLVVEDDYFIAKDLARTLGAAGAKVVGPAATVTDALILIDAEQPDGAVLDINLRGDLVYPVAETLTERGIPFVFATGYASGAIPERFAAVARYEKPVELDVILRSLFASR